MGNKMMNEDQPPEALKAWSVQTGDVADRVAAAIGATRDPLEDLLQEIRALRRDIEGMRQANAQLQEEVSSLRLDLGIRTVTRLSPYSAAESLARLS